MRRLGGQAPAAGPTWRGPGRLPGPGPDACRCPAAVPYLPGSARTDPC
jgi:hypothetical protein